MANESDKLVVEGRNTIPDQLWANVMRESMENKNLLVRKGAVYVGTGEVNTVDTNDRDVDGNYVRQEIAKTKAVNPPSTADGNAPAAGMYFLGTHPEGEGVGWQKLAWELPITSGDWVSSTAGLGKLEATLTFDGVVLSNGSAFVQVQRLVDNQWITFSTPVKIGTNSITVYTSEDGFEGKVLLLNIG